MAGIFDILNGGDKPAAISNYDMLKVFGALQASSMLDDEKELRERNLELQNEMLMLQMPEGYGETSRLAQIAPFLGAGIARSMPSPSHEMALSDINLAKRFPELKEFVTKPRTGTWNIPGLEWINSMKGPAHAPSNATSASSLISRLFRR